MVGLFDRYHGDGLLMKDKVRVHLICWIVLETLYVLSVTL